jgi:hypothetical protein
VSSLAWIVGGQFIGALADNALLLVVIQMLVDRRAPAWTAPALRVAFYLSFVLLSAHAGAAADAWPKKFVLFAVNALKLAGCALLLVGQRDDHRPGGAAPARCRRDARRRDAGFRLPRVRALRIARARGAGARSQCPGPGRHAAKLSWRAAHPVARPGGPGGSGGHIPRSLSCTASLPRHSCCSWPESSRASWWYR